MSLLLCMASHWATSVRLPGCHTLTLGSMFCCTGRLYLAIQSAEIEPNKKRNNVTLSEKNSLIKVLPIKFYYRGVVQPECIYIHIQTQYAGSLAYYTSMRACSQLCRVHTVNTVTVSTQSIQVFEFIYIITTFLW